YVPGLVGCGRSPSRAGYFDLLPLHLSRQTEIDQVQVQRREQGLRKPFGDLRCPVAGPDGGKRGERDQVPHGAAKSPGFVGAHVHRPRPSQHTPVLLCPVPSRSSRRNSSGGTKNGFSWRTPPIITIECVRKQFMTMLAPNRVRSEMQHKASS